MGTKTIGTRTDPIRTPTRSRVSRTPRAWRSRARESPRDSSPRSANSTPPPRKRPPPPPRRIFRRTRLSDPAAEYAAARATVSGAYRESVARLLTTMTGRRGAGAPPLARRWATFPSRTRYSRSRVLPSLASTSLAVLRAVASLSRDASAAASMRRAGAVPKLARFLQWEDPETRDVAFRALRNVCASSRRPGRNKPPSPARCRTSSPSRRPNRRWRTGRRTTRRMLVGTVTQKRRVEVYSAPTGTARTGSAATASSPRRRSSARGVVSV